MGMICDTVTSYDNNNKKDDYGDDFDMLLAGTVTRVMILGNDHLDNRNTYDDYVNNIHDNNIDDDSDANSKRQQ